MAYRIAGDVVSRIAPPPPPGAPPELVLAAVLAERHRRELARLRPTMPADADRWAVAGPPAAGRPRVAAAGTSAADPLAGGWPQQAPTGRRLFAASLMSAALAGRR